MNVGRTVLLSLFNSSVLLAVNLVQELKETLEHCR